MNQNMVFVLTVSSVYNVTAKRVVWRRPPLVGWRFENHLPAGNVTKFYPLTTATVDTVEDINFDLVCLYGGNVCLFIIINLLIYDNEDVWLDLSSRRAEKSCTAKSMHYALILGHGCCCKRGVVTGGFEGRWW